MNVISRIIAAVLVIASWAGVARSESTSILKLPSLSLCAELRGAERVKGVRLNLYGEVGELQGLDLGIANVVATKFRGVQLGALNHVGRAPDSDDAKGLQVGVLNHADGLFYGVQAGVACYSDNLKAGVQLSLLSATKVSTGHQFGLMYNWTGNGTGGSSLWGLFTAGRETFAQTGLFNYAEDCDKLQLGCINFANATGGCQIGLLNWIVESYDSPLQIGLINVMEDNPVKVMPIVNMRWW
jgi:hypothetical protein